MKLKRMRGTKDMLPSYLDEEVWRDRFGYEVYDNIIQHIAKQNIIRDGDRACARAVGN